MATMMALYTALSTSQTPTGGVFRPQAHQGWALAPHISDQEGGSIRPYLGCSSRSPATRSDHLI